MSLLYLPENVEFGSPSLATNYEGDRILVGAPYDTAGVDAGVAYIVDTNTGELLQTLSQPCPQPADHFGVSVAMNCDGTRVLVGAKKAYSTNQTIQSPGIVYLFDIHNDGAATLLQTIQNPAPQDFDGFGVGLALDKEGKIIAIAAPNHNKNEGVVYVFDERGQMVNEFRPPTQDKQNISGEAGNNTQGSQDQFFGSSIDISGDGDKIAVGAPGKGWAKQLPGTVYLISTLQGEVLETIHNPSTTSLNAISTEGDLSEAYTPERDDYFGLTVAMNGDGSRIAVGAMPAAETSAESSSGGKVGKAYIFNEKGTLITAISRPNYHLKPHISQDHFGISVALNVEGDQILVGSPHKGLVYSNASIAFLWDESRNETTEFYNPTIDGISKENVQFGGSVVMAPSGDYAFISSAYHPMVQLVCLRPDGTTCQESQPGILKTTQKKSSFIKYPAIEDGLCIITSKQSTSFYTKHIGTFVLPSAAMIVFVFVLLRKRLKTRREDIWINANAQALHTLDLTDSSWELDSPKNLPEVI
jgi:hypothetical protein